MYVYTGFSYLQWNKTYWAEKLLLNKYNFFTEMAVIWKSTKLVSLTKLAREKSYVEVHITFMNTVES